MPGTMAIRSLPVFGAIPTQIQTIPVSNDPEALTQQTLRQMAVNIGASTLSPAVQKATMGALQPLRGPASSSDKARAIFAWIKRHVTFIPDKSILQSIGIYDEDEALIAPDRLLTMPKPQGDCDCFSQLAAAMLLNAGVKNHLATIAADPQEPDRWSHVYNIVEDENGREIAFDGSHGKFFGWEAPRYFRKQVWRLMPYKGSLDNQVIHGKADRVTWNRRDTGIEQVVNAKGGFRGLGIDPSTTELNLPWSDTGWNASVPAGGGFDLTSNIFSIANIFAKSIAPAVGASIMPGGTMVQTAQGTTVIGTGQPYAGTVGLNLGGSNMGTLLLLAGGAVLLIMVMKSSS